MSDPSPRLGKKRPTRARKAPAKTQTTDAATSPSVIFRNPVRQGFIESGSESSKSTIYFEDTGIDGPVLLFIYGLGCSIMHWKHQLLALEQSGTHRLVWLDYRAHGRSAPLAAGATIHLTDLCDDIEAVCSHLNLRKVTLFGQSMGGTIALLMAHHHPALVRGLVLVAAPPKPPSQTLNVGKIGVAAWNATIATNKIAPALVRRGMGAAQRLARPARELIRILGFNAHLAQTHDIDEYVKELFKTNPNVFWDLAAELERLDLQNLLPQINNPVLVIAGALDQVVPLDHSLWLAKRLPNAEIEIVKHGSHCPHFDDPRHVTRRIERFLQTHGL